MKIYNKLGARAITRDPLPANPKVGGIVTPLNSKPLAQTSDLIVNQVKARLGSGSNSTGLQANLLQFKYNRRKYLKGFLGQGYSPALNSNAFPTGLHQNTKAVVYSFNKVNNLSPLLTKTEYLLKSVFRSIFSLISRPIYLIKHDKVIIRLFVYLSPKIDKYLDTSTIGTRKVSDNLGDSTTSNLYIGRSVAGFAANINRFKIGKFLKFKSLRPNVIDILKSQIHHEGINQSLQNLLPSNCWAQGCSINKYPYISLVSNFKFKLEKLCLLFEQNFNQKVEFEIIKAQLPFQDSNILAQVLGYNANNYKFRRMLKILIPRAVIKNPSKVYLRSPAASIKGELLPALGTGQEELLASLQKCSAPSGTQKEQSISYLSGMNIKLAGRLMTQSIRPRFTVQSLQEGSLARVKVHYIEKSRFTGKNKRGAFSFTVTISHVFN